MSTGLDGLWRRDEMTSEAERRIHIVAENHGGWLK